MEHPSILVRILHSIPHVNYTFRRVNDTFNPDSDVYLESLGILASIPAGLLIISLFGLLLYLLTRCCDRKPRKMSAQRCQSCSLVIITLMTCAAIGLGLYGNDDFHNGLLQAFSSGKQVEGLVLSLKRQTESIKYDLENKMAQYRLETQIEKIQYNQTAVTLLLETCSLVRENTSRAVTSLDNMVLYFMKTKGSENETSLMGLLHLGELYESIRWPVTLGFLTLLLLLCTILVIGVARRSRCALIFFSVSGLFCIIVSWLLAGVYLASSVAAGDFCMRPHEYMCRQVGMRSPYVYFLNCGTLRNRFILRLNESRDLVERAREAVYLVKKMSLETYPRIEVQGTLEAMDNDLEETKRNLTVLSATLDRRAIDKHYAEALRGLCGGGLLGLSLMMVAGLLTSFLLTILIYADSHAWIYLTKRPPLDVDKSETTPLFPTATPNATISPSAPLNGGTINRTLLHHQQAHGGLGASSTMGHGVVGGSNTLGSHRNGTAGMRQGLTYSKHPHHKTNASGAGGAGDGKASPSPPPGYDVVVHGTRSGHHTLGRLPSHHQQSSSSYLTGPNNGTNNTNSHASLKNIFASATLPRSSASSIKSVLSAQTTGHSICKSIGGDLDNPLSSHYDDKDPRDVTNNGFNRFDPKYVSIGPKVVRGSNSLNIAGAGVNKCATLRHVGRYGGSLKGASPSPNLRSAKTPSIATVSKDYCQQPDCIPQTYNTNALLVPPPPQQQQPSQVLPQQSQPLPPIPPSKPKTANTFTDIPGTTGVGSCYAQEQQPKESQAPPPPPPQPQPQPQTPQLQNQPQQLHPSTTHVLPPSAVYSIETSGYQQQQQQQQQQPRVLPPQPPQSHPPLLQHVASAAAATATSDVREPSALPTREATMRQQRALNPASIINQPLPEIPQQHQVHQPQQLSKISAQPLCAANLNQYRSLQRPSQKLQISTQQQQQQLQPHTQYQQQQQQPPSLPPKNRHKDSRATASSSATNANHLQTLPPKSATLRQQQTAASSYPYERNRERSSERPRRSETLDNGRMSYLEQYGNAGGSAGLKKQHSYDPSYPQHYYQQQQQHQQPLPPTRNASNSHQHSENNNYHHAHSTGKPHQQQQQQYNDQQHLYYRSLKRGGSHANNDLYSVTEL